MVLPLDESGEPHVAPSADFTSPLVGTTLPRGNDNCCRGANTRKHVPASELKRGVSGSVVSTSANVSRPITARARRCQAPPRFSRSEAPRTLPQPNAVTGLRTVMEPRPAKS